MAYQIKEPPQVCPRCKRFLKQKVSGHIKRCLELPSAEEIATMLDANEYESLLGLSEKYRCGLSRIRDILLAGETHWTMEKLKERTKHARYQPQRGRPQVKGKRRERRKFRRIDHRKGRLDCAKGCGVLVQKAGEICAFCYQEELGFRNRNDILSVAPDDPRLAIVRKGYHSYPSQERQ
jgi:hypothetical protein